jgi:hypothetical protein
MGFSFQIIISSKIWTVERGHRATAKPCRPDFRSACLIYSKSFVLVLPRE